MGVLISGGAGFIGVNLADRLLGQGEAVTVLDDLSRPGSEKNLAWLRRAHPGRPLAFVRGDISRPGAVDEALRQVTAVFHLAAQVAVTSSVSDPERDFQVNAAGTLNMLEAVRRAAPRAPFIFASTNKVYGAFDGETAAAAGDRYVLADRPRGIAETTPLDFHSPYGCSKGAADQYVRDYARIYGLDTVVFRQSCIYGPHQYGNEDQGWVAFFLLCALRKREITIFGDGCQVRDILYVDDLIDLFLAARRDIGRCRGRIYNIGGGPENTLSLRELLAWLEKRLGRAVARRFSDWRPGDQKVYISDIRRAAADLDWRPRVGVAAGLERLLAWLEENR